MITIDAIKRRYRESGNEPLSRRELAAMYGTKWMNDPAQIEEFMRLFVLCRDGMIRIRGTIAEFNAA